MSQIPVFSGKEVQLWDQYTMAHEPISSMDLMERASRQLFNAFLAEKSVESYRILVGPGNNGGDGLALARMLQLKRCAVEVFIPDFVKGMSPDAAINLNRAQENNIPIRYIALTDFKDILKDNKGVWVDALFGSGLTRPLEGVYADFVEVLNQANVSVWSVDIPSGVPGALHGALDYKCFVKAEKTFTFQCLKWGHIHTFHGPFCGGVQVLDIGLDPHFLNEVPLKAIQMPEIKLPLPDPFEHKGKRGRVLVVNTESSMMGAMELTIRGALKIGVGVIYAYHPKDYSFSSHAVVHLKDFERWELDQFKSVLIGPGLGMAVETKVLFQRVLAKVKVPMVIDADAIRLLAEDANLVKILPPNSIITPHLKELAYLIGEWKDEEEQLKRTLEFAEKHHVYVLIKGRYSRLCTPSGMVLVNPTGNHLLATGGSGDVLSGMLLASLSYLDSVEQAYIYAIRAHGAMADRALQMHPDRRAMGIETLLEC